MNIKEKNNTIILIAIIVLISIILAIYISKRENKMISKQKNEQSFSAKIESMRENENGEVYVNVKGLESNYEDFKGEFSFKINDKTNINFGGKKIDSSNLKEGDTILITFKDEYLTDIIPTPLENVTKVELLK